MRDPAERLRDILEAIEKIEVYADQGKDSFEQDPLIQSWFIRHLQLIGEAARTLPEDIRSLTPDIQWKDIIGMRQILVHHYFGIDSSILWNVVEQDLPILKPQVEALLQILLSKDN